MQTVTTTAGRNPSKGSSYTGIVYLAWPERSQRGSMEALQEEREMPIVMRKRNHPFVINDPVTGRSVRVRFIAKAQEIDDCLSAWEIIGSPARTDRLQDDSSLAAAA